MNQNFSELEARRLRRQQRKSEPKPEIVRAAELVQKAPKVEQKRRPSSTSSRREVKHRSSFGVSATPSVRTSQTQTEAQVKSVRKYASMSDIRKSRGQPVDSAMTTSLTESDESVTDTGRQKIQDFIKNENESFIFLLNKKIRKT